MKATILVTVDPYDENTHKNSPFILIPITKKLVVELDGVTLTDLKSALHDTGINQIWKIVNNVFAEADAILAKSAPELPKTEPLATPIQPAIEVITEKNLDAVATQTNEKTNGVTEQANGVTEQPNGEPQTNGAEAKDKDLRIPPLPTSRDIPKP